MHFIRTQDSGQAMKKKSYKHGLAQPTVFVNIQQSLAFSRLPLLICLAGS